MKNLNSEVSAEILNSAQLLLNPRLNKGTAFSLSERDKYGLHGLLPDVVETLSQQVSRAYDQFSARTSNLSRNLYLNELYTTNTTLFFALVSTHLSEMLPIIYTPTIGEAVVNFSSNFMRQSGLIISWPERHRIDQILAQFAGQLIDVAVVTDGEGVLGIGDQGIGGLSIATGKLMVYTLCGGLNPFKTLAIQLDPGTNNERLLNDPLYLGWRHPRLSGKDYHEFIEQFVQAFRCHLPNTLLHWEDFGRDNARTVLDRYRNVHQSFNDDIQGTGAVAVAAVLTGIRKSNRPAASHRICIFGAGTAGTGIAEQICHALAESEGTDIATVRKRVYMIDRAGLLVAGQPDLMPFQIPYARNQHEIANWKLTNEANIGLADVVENIHPTILVGCSTQAGAFSAEIMRNMARHCSTPIIMALSNPTSKAETTPETILAATSGKALIATGSPFGKVLFAGAEIEISQCNNALIFPGLGMGMLISKARTLTDTMLLQASKALSQFCVSDQSANALLPNFSRIEEISATVAMAVAQRAIKDGVAEPITERKLHETLTAIHWQPEYDRN